MASKRSSHRCGQKRHGSRFRIQIFKTRSFGASLTLLAYGDPGSLSISAREKILQNYAVKEATAQTSDERLEPRALWMFANEQLTPAIRKAWHTNRHEEFRFDLFNSFAKAASRVQRRWQNRSR